MTRRSWLAVGLLSVTAMASYLARVNVSFRRFRAQISRYMRCSRSVIVVLKLSHSRVLSLK